MEHPGEVAVQERLGVSLTPWGSAKVGSHIPAVAADFLAAQHLAIISARDNDGLMWVTMLTGEPGFLAVQPDSSILCRAVPGPADPLLGVFDRQREVGMLIVDLSTRRRMRVNGSAIRVDDMLVIRPGQVYANCPKYIQQRHRVSGSPKPPPPRRSSGRRLSGAQQQLISGADTFFVGTQADPMGADASHRGGSPGFVTVVAPDSLAWPEYAGNKMYMTLGNLELDPRAGLLFIDWNAGHALHLSGRAHPEWESSGRSDPGMCFTIEHVVAVEHASALRWGLGRV